MSIFLKSGGVKNVVIGSKATEIVYADDGTAEAKVSAERRASRALDDSQIKTLCAEAITGDPALRRDVEGGMAYEEIRVKYPSMAQMFDKFMENNGYKLDFNCCCIYSRSFIEAPQRLMGIIRPLIGAEETPDDGAEKTASLGVFLAAAAGVLLAVISVIFVQPFSELLGGSASEELLDSTVSYMTVICVGIPFQMLSTTVYNQLRLCGNIKDGMIGMGVGMFGNLFLDPVFILGFDMGITGAGIASTIGQIASCIVLYIISAKHGNIPMRFFSFDLKNRRLYHILLGGAPNFSRQSITSIASVLLNNAAVPYGASLIAAMTVSSRVSAAAYLMMIGFGQGFQPICAINYGAKQYARVKAAFRMTVTIGTVFLTLAGALLAVFAEPLTAAFSSSDHAVTEKAALMVRLQCISFPFMPFYAVSGMYILSL